MIFDKEYKLSQQAKIESLKCELKDIKTEIEFIRNKIEDVKNNQFVYEQTRFTGLSFYPFEKVKYTIPELVEAFLEHTGMELTKEVTPEITEIKFTKPKKVKS